MPKPHDRTATVSGLRSKSFRDLDIGIVNSLQTSSCVPESSTPSCKGEMYTVKAGDNCNAIAMAQNVSTVALQKLNDIPADCKNLGIGQQL